MMGQCCWDSDDSGWEQDLSSEMCAEAHHEGPRARARSFNVILHWEAFGGTEAGQWHHLISVVENGL